MTQKELLYYKDAIGHETSIIKIIEEAENNLLDEELKEFMKNELEVHNKMKENLLSTMEENCHE